MDYKSCGSGDNSVWCCDNCGKGMEEIKKIGFREGKVGNISKLMNAFTTRYVGYVGNARM